MNLTLTIFLMNPQKQNRAKSTEIQLSNFSHLYTLPILLPLLPFIIGLAVRRGHELQNSRFFPILSGHSHNDYQRPIPLWDAIENGFISIEVDIHLVNGSLLVGHDEDDLRDDLTLESLYLNPLREYILRQDGWIYPNKHQLILFIDIKSDAESTYNILSGVLAQYSDIVTTYSNNKAQEKAIAVVISGNRSREIMVKERTRFATYDGRLNDLDEANPSNFIKIISDNWEDHFSWRGNETISDNDREKLIRIVQAVHKKGYQIRFWKVPSDSRSVREAVWDELLSAGVDLVTTDELEEYRDFLLRKK